MTCDCPVLFLELRFTSHFAKPYVLNSNIKVDYSNQNLYNKI